MLTRLGAYELISHVSTGGMAEVFKARQRGPSGFSKEVAVKLLLPELADDPSLVELFSYEARLVAKLSHPNICQVLDVGQAQGRHYMVLEYLSGQTLGRLIKRATRQGVQIAPRVAAYVVARAADALAYAHGQQGPDGKALEVVHRDVSPTNLMVTYRGEVKLLDFGIARASDRTFRTRTGELRGKLAYMSPEQLRNVPVDHRSDVFSLGAVLFEAISGRQPFDKESDLATIEAVLRGPKPTLAGRTDVPPELIAVVDHMLERDLERRTQTAGEVARALEPLAGPRAQAELAELMERLFADERTPQEDEAATELVRRQTARVDEPPPARGQAPRRWLAFLGAAAVVLAGVFAFVALRSEPTPVTTVAQAMPAVAVPAQPDKPSVAPPPSNGAPPSSEPLPLPEPPRALAPPTKPTSPPKTAPTAKPGRANKAPPREQKVAVAEATGRLTLDSQPWADIYFQGKVIGTTPLFEVLLPVGKHRLRAVNREANIDRAFDVTIGPNELTTRKVKW